MLTSVPMIVFGLLRLLFPAVTFVVSLKAYNATAGRPGQTGWFSLMIGNAGHTLVGLASLSVQALMASAMNENDRMASYGYINGALTILGLAASGFLLAGTISLAQTYCGLFQVSEPSGKS